MKYSSLFNNDTGSKTRTFKKFPLPIFINFSTVYKNNSGRLVLNKECGVNMLFSINIISC